MVENHSLFCIPTFNWVRSPSIVFHIELATSDEAPAVRQALRVMFPHQLPLSTEAGVYGGRSTHPALVATRVHVDSAAAIQETIAALLSIRGVRRVSPDYPLKTRVYPAWFDAKVKEQVESNASREESAAPS